MMINKHAKSLRFVINNRLHFIQSSSYSPKAKEALISRLLQAKDDSKKSFDEIATHLGLTNVYTAQLFMNQAQLKPHTVSKLREIVPLISSDDLVLMQRSPFRSFDPHVRLCF